MFMSLVNQNKSSDVISATERHVHVLISMVSHISETKKTRANVVFDGIFYTFFCFRFFKTYFSFLFFQSFKSQRYTCILSLITQTELFVCLIRIIYNFMHQIRVNLLILT